MSHFVVSPPALPENGEDEDEEEDDEAGGDDEEGEAVVLRPVGSILLHVGGAGGANVKIQATCTALNTIREACTNCLGWNMISSKQMKLS